MKTVVVNQQSNNVAIYEVTDTNAIWLRVRNKSTHTIYIYPEGDVEDRHTILAGQTKCIVNNSNRYNVEVQFTDYYGFGTDCIVQIAETNYYVPEQVDEIAIYKGLASKINYTSFFVGEGWYHMKAYESWFTDFADNRHINFEVYQLPYGEDYYGNLQPHWKYLRLYPLLGSSGTGTYHFRYFYLDRPANLYAYLNNITDDCYVELYKLTNKPTANRFTQHANMGNFFISTPAFQSDGLTNISVIYKTVNGINYSATFVVYDVSGNVRLLNRVSGVGEEDKKLDIAYPQTGYNSDIYVAAENVSGIQAWRVICYYEL